MGATENDVFIHGLQPATIGLGRKDESGVEVQHDGGQSYTNQPALSQPSQMGVRGIRSRKKNWFPNLRLVTTEV